MEIRRNHSDDLPAFVALNLAWIEELHTVECSDQKMADNPNIYIENGNSMFAAIIDEQVAGVCALKQDEDGAWELTKMAVDPKFRGHGLGKTIMETVESYAKNEMGLEKIYLLSSTVNAAAIRLYKRQGWTVFLEGEHPKYSRCNIGMEKIL